MVGGGTAGGTGGEGQVGQVLARGRRWTVRDRFGTSVSHLRVVIHRLEIQRSGVCKIAFPYIKTMRTKPDKPISLEFVLELLLFKEAKAFFCTNIVYIPSTHYMELWICSIDESGEAITRVDQNSTWLSIYSCCCFAYLYSQMPRLWNWPKGSQQLLPLRHICILHNPMEKEKAWVSQATKFTVQTGRNHSHS